MGGNKVNIGASGSTGKKTVFFFTYAAVFATFFDTHSLLPIISLYAKELGAGVALAGIIIGAFSLANSGANIPAGYLIDRVGRKKPLVLSLSAMSIILFSYTLATSPRQLLVLRMFHGLAAASLGPATMAILGDLAPKGERGQVMAFYGAAIGFTVLLGPPLSGAIKDLFGFSYVFYMLSFMMAVTAMFSYTFIPDIRASGQSLYVRRRDILKRRNILASYTAAFVLMFTLGVLVVMLPLYMEGLGFSVTQTGFMFSSFAATAIIIQMLPTRRLSDILGRKVPIITGLGMIAVSISLLPFLSTLYLLLLAMAVYGIGFGLLFPAMSALIIDDTSEYERGTAMGIFHASYTLGVAIGASAIGIIIKIHDPFKVGGVITLIGMVIATLLISENKRIKIQRSNGLKVS